MSRFLLLVVLLLGCGVTTAQTREPRIKIVPTEGAWVSDSVPNTGWFLDVDESDFGFVAWYTYDAQGRSTFLVLQGLLEYRSESARRSTGIVASLTSQIFEADNGACPTCPPQPANIRPSSLGTGVIEWRSARRGVIRYAGQVVELHPFALTVPEANIVEGIWQLNDRGSPSQVKGSAVLRVRKVPAFSLHSYPSSVTNGPPLDPSTYDFGPLPSMQAVYYAFDCLAGCVNGDIYSDTPSGPIQTSKPASWVMWYENGVFRMINYYAVNPAFFPSAFQVNGGSLPVEVFPSQDKIVGRKRLSASLAFCCEFQLTRLPSNWLDAN